MTRTWRRVLVGFFPIVESFPRYIANTLAKTSYGQRAGDHRVRAWLLKNLQVEARHAEWYIDWVEGTGVSRETLFRTPRSAGVKRLHEHLWTTTDAGSMAAGLAASNFAIEGVTGVWSQAVTEPFRGYAAQGFQLSPRSMMWLKAHGHYDDAHPHEALEAIKYYADPSGGLGETPEGVSAATRLSLDLFREAMQALY